MGLRDFFDDRTVGLSYIGVMVRAFILASAIGCLFFVANAQSDPISRKVIERHDIPGSTEELQMILIEYQPGASAPSHAHPVIGLNYIIEGVAESQYEGEPIKTFKAGDSYQDPANKRHLIFRNASKSKPLKFLVACKILKGEPFSKALTNEVL